METAQGANLDRKMTAVTTDDARVFKIRNSHVPCLDVSAPSKKRTVAGNTVSWWNETKGSQERNKVLSAGGFRGPVTQNMRAVLYMGVPPAWFQRTQAASVERSRDRIS